MGEGKEGIFDLIFIGYVIGVWRWGGKGRKREGGRENCDKSVRQNGREVVDDVILDFIGMNEPLAKVVFKGVNSVCSPPIIDRGIEES